jgi:glycosyltransferase involved in cell wall biosynthesis
MGEYIILEGFMEYSKMCRYLEDFHIGLTVHSDLERFALIGRGSSRKNFTYMCAGMVVVTTNIGEMAAITQEENCGVTINGFENLQRVASVIKTLDGDREYAVKLAQNGIRAIREKYNWSIEEKKVLSLYQLVWALSAKR